MNRSRGIVFTFVVSSLFFLASCAKEGCTDANAVNYDPNAKKDDQSCVYEAELNIPSSYQFVRDGVSTVSYSGQTVRLMLIHDLVAMIEDLGKPGATSVLQADMLQLYEYDDAVISTMIEVPGYTLLEGVYSNIGTGKDLTGKVDNSYNADTDIRAWIAIIAANSQTSKLGTAEVYTTSGNAPYADGLDICALIEKTLFGSLVYSQATGNYLNGISGDDNSAVLTGKSYTEMEHHWDEAFGYFGAARDFYAFSDLSLTSAGSHFRDENGDGMIDLRSEYNAGFSRYAASRDIFDNNGDGSAAGTDYTKEIFDGFLKGRAAIAAEDYEARDEGKQEVLTGLEKVIAASIIHDLNSTRSAMADSAAINNPASLNRYWANMYGGTLALRYNPDKQVSDADIATLTGYMGDSPTYDLPGTGAYDTALTNLDAAKSLLQTLYGFSNSQIENW